MMKPIAVIFCVLLLTSCGGGSDSGYGRIGATSFDGVWELRTIARLGIAGGTATGGDFRTTVRVFPTGEVFVESVGIGCTFRATAQANFLFYEQKCVIENTSCIAEIEGIAQFVNDSVFSNFGPHSFICEGGGIITGNITGRKIAQTGTSVPLAKLVE